MVALIIKNGSWAQFCQSRESQWTNFDTWLWNGMMELVDMPRMSDKGFRGPFCVPKLGTSKFWFGDLFCMRAGPLREKKHRIVLNAESYNRSLSRPHHENTNPCSLFPTSHSLLAPCCPRLICPVDHRCSRTHLMSSDCPVTAHLSLAHMPLWGGLLDLLSSKLVF